MKKVVICVAGALVVLVIAVLLRQKNTPTLVAMLPLTGTAAYIGEDEKIGIEIARNEIGHDIEVVYEDTQAKADVALNILQRRGSVEGKRLFYVSTTPPTVTTLEAIKNNEWDALVFAIATMPGLTKGFQFATRIYPTAETEARLHAQFVIKSKFRNVAVVYLKMSAIEAGVQCFSREIEKDGVSVTIRESFTDTDKDFRTILQKISRFNVDAIYIGGYAPHFESFILQAHELGISKPVMAGIATAQLKPKTVDEFERYKNVVFPAADIYINPNREDVKQFVVEMAKKGRPINFEAAYAYDTAKMFFLAANKTGNGSAQELLKEILLLAPYKGVTGVIRFDENRDAILELNLCRFAEGGIEEVR